jgi:hypothetical protein
MQNQTDKPSADTGTQADQERSETAMLDRNTLRENYLLTSRIDEQPEVIASPYWGNALLGRSARLQLEVEGYNHDPIQTHIRDQLVIGRLVPDAGNQPDIDLTPYGGIPQGVSRRHLMITKEGNLLKVTDLGSTNGTYLNGVRLQPRQPRLLRTGDRLSLGQLVIRVSSLI